MACYACADLVYENCVKTKLRSAVESSQARAILYAIYCDDATIFDLLPAVMSFVQVTEIIFRLGGTSKTMYGENAIMGFVGNSVIGVILAQRNGCFERNNFAQSKCS